MTVRASVFTPSHNPRFLDDCYRSMAAQTFADWEWIVLLNGKNVSWTPPDPDSRIRVERTTQRIRSVGAAKREACARATGDILIELDHADLLTVDAIAQIVDVMTTNPQAVLAYSDFAQINADGSPSQAMFDTSNGWTYNDVTINGTTYLQCRAMEPFAHNVGYIWYAPNHLKAFRRSSYEAVGGYDDSLPVADDHELMIRLFEHGPFVHVPRCLYLQRLHDGKAQADPRANAAIQQETVDLYRGHIEHLALAAAQRAGLGALFLATPMTTEAIDIDERFSVVMIDPNHPRLDVANDSVGVIKAADVLQRVPDRAAFLNECYRAMHHGALLLTDTPSTDGRGAFQDPSNVAFYNENSFLHLTQASMRPTIPALTARLQVSHLVTYFPSEVHQEIDIPYVKANLLAIKHGPRQGGPLLC